jgi:hypothetical protein
MPVPNGAGLKAEMVLIKESLSNPPARHREPARSGEADGGIFPGQGTVGFSSDAPLWGAYLEPYSSGADSLVQFIVFAIWHAEHGTFDKPQDSLGCATEKDIIHVASVSTTSHYNHVSADLECLLVYFQVGRPWANQFFHVLNIHSFLTKDMIKFFFGTKK